MAETVLGWKLLTLLGMPLLGASFFAAWQVRLGDIDFNSIPEPWKNVMYFASTVYIFVFTWRTYQKGRTDQIKNNDNEFDLKIKKGEYEHTHKK